MTINELINLVDDMKPNDYTKDDKVKWLNRLDTQIYMDIMQTHADNPVEDFEGYTTFIESKDEELLISAPFDDIYRWYVESQIDYSNGELAKYNNSVAMFNERYSEYERWYNRTHQPLHFADGIKFFKDTEVIVNENADA